MRASIRPRRASVAPSLLVLLPLLLACRDSGGDSSEPPPMGPVPATLAGELGVAPIAGGVVLEQEPNDSQGQVQYIGPIGPGSVYAIRGDTTDDGSDPFDGFRFVTDAPVTLNMVLDFLEPTADLDFFLLDVASGETLVTFETKENPEVGEYTFEASGVEFDLVLFAFSGASEYTLTVTGTEAVPGSPSASLVRGSRSPDLAARYLGAQHPMVPGRVVVLEDDAAFASPARADFLAQEGLELVSRTPDGTSIYRLMPSEAAKHPSGAPGAWTASLQHATARKASRFSRQPGVRAASPDYILQAFDTPSDTHYPLQWHYPQLKLPLAWDLATGSSDVIVGVIDTGHVQHPDLLPRIVGQYDFISDPAVANDGDGMDASALDPGDGQAGLPSSWHGTHVSGTVGAVSDDQDGVAGVDWASGLLSLRALGVGGGSTADIAAAVRYAARLSNASGQLPAERADVLNMSLGTPAFSQVLKDACDAAVAAGVTIVAAAGNEPNSLPKYPGAFASVIAVGSVRYDKQLAPYSTFGGFIDVVAPGGDLNVDQNGDGYPDGVLSTYTDGAGDFFYAYQQGTSMASPHVAGVAALLCSVLPNATPADIRALLRTTAQDLGAPGFDTTYGHGLVDARAALVAATDPRPTEPALVVEPVTIDLGSQLVEFPVSLDNGGGGFVDVALVEVTYLAESGWLSTQLVEAPEGAGISHSTLLLTADRTGLSPGHQLAQVTITADSLPPVQVEVQISTGADALPDLTVFVLVVDAATLETVEQAITDLAADYAWQMPEVPPGGYLLAAGTDVDDDGFIGDGEEPLFGMWPSPVDPQVLDVTEGAQLPELDFPVTTGAIGPMASDGFAGFRRL